jgi:hypothetical protein
MVFSFLLSSYRRLEVRMIALRRIIGLFTRLKLIVDWAIEPLTI